MPNSAGSGSRPGGVGGAHADVRRRALARNAFAFSDAHNQRGTRLARLRQRGSVHREESMLCTRLTTIAVTLTAMSMAGPAFAQTPAQPAPASPPAAAPSPAPAAPLFATTKVEGTDNVYVFRYQNHQSMFVVTPAGVIATDPISYGRPQAATTYVDEIRKITKARDRRPEAHDQARRHDARSRLHRAQPLRLVAGDAPAEGEDRLRGRLQ